VNERLISLKGFYARPTANILWDALITQIARRGLVKVRLAVALDPDLGIGVDALAASWDADDEARRLAWLGSSLGGWRLLAGVVELVAVPLVVNVTSGALYDILKRLIAKLGGTVTDSSEELEVAEVA
jgi:hypothetical protein